MAEPEIAGTRSLGRSIEASSSTELLRMLGWTVAAVVCVEYVYYFATRSVFPLQDFPNHLARGAVIADLLFDHGVRFGQTYTLALLPIPYVLHDLLLAVLIDLFGINVGGAIFIVVTMLSLPLALLFYMRVTQLAPRAHVFVFIVGLYLATDWFFLMAFMGFRLALALLLVTLALVELLRREWSNRTFGWYAAVVAIGYLTHLTALAFLVLALAVATPLRLWLGLTDRRRELCIWAPPLTLLVIHFGSLLMLQGVSAPGRFEFLWGTWAAKIEHLAFEFTRFGSELEHPMLWLFAACLLLPLRRYLQWSRFAQPTVIEPLLIAGAFLAFYFIAPQRYSDSSFVDVRALPVVTLMLLIACLNVPGRQSLGRSFCTWPVLALAAVLSIVNFGYLVRHVGKNEVTLTQYRELGSAVPQGSHVLPIYTIRKDGDIRPMMHAGSYLVADRGAVIPYLFSGDRGDPMRYFRYRDRPYEPNELWYSDRRNARSSDKPSTVDWNRVACEYDYLLMTRPVDMRLIGVPTRPVSANRTASLVAVDKSVCRPQRVARVRSS